MSYNIEKHLTKINKGKKGDNTPEWIIVHFVGASGQALANANYFRTTYRGASAHYFVDPNTIAQVVEDDTPAWHIGDGSRTGKGTHNGYVVPGGATNTNSIGIEGCQDTSTGKDVWHWDFHPKTVDKIEWLVKELQKKYNIDDDHVIRHYDASGKICPGNWQWDNWSKWEQFHDRLEKDITQPAPKGNSNPEGKHADEHMHLVEEGETLYGIAKDHGVTVEQLVQWNDLENKNLIFPETKLFVKKPEVNDEPKTDIEQLARDVIAGKYGSGAERKKKLGDNYDEVQDMVNKILLGKVKSESKPKKSIDQLAKEVIDGKHGSGAERKESLGSQYEAVQKRVNELLGVKKPKVAPKPQPKTITQLAKEVIDGQHGSGEARKKALGAQYEAVQKRVNELLGSKSTKSRKSIDELADEVIRGLHGSGRERMISLGNRYTEVQKEVNRRLR